MNSAGTTVIERYGSALDAFASAAPTSAELRAMDDDQLLQLNQLQAGVGRTAGTVSAQIAGELAYRSRPELGGQGLARRSGHRTVENLLKTTTGAPKDQVISIVNTGTLLHELDDEGSINDVTGEVSVPTKPWLRPVAAAVATGALTVAASHSIARGLGEPNSAVSAETLEKAATELVAEALAGADADRLFRGARDRRNELDVTGVKLRDRELFDARSLTHYPVPSGGGVATWRMDTETYARFVDFYDRSTSPKRGGVRFVDPAKVEKARKIEQDPRTYKQLASDSLIQLLLAGANADPSVMLGSGAPIIRITVAETALRTGVGFGRVDGQPEVIPIDSVRRLMENGKSLRVRFDPRGRYIEQYDDPLAENRLYNSRQREILAAKFGGCMHPNCDRPPSWCEAHHIQWVVRDGGKTTISNAILLCRYHHLLYHRDGYEIRVHDDGTYWLIPPASIDAAQQPIAMPLKSRALKDLWDAHERALVDAK